MDEIMLSRNNLSLVFFYKKVMSKYYNIIFLTFHYLHGVCQSPVDEKRKIILELEKLAISFYNILLLLINDSLVHFSPVLYVICKIH